jgi:hypothetical protein
MYAGIAFLEHKTPLFAAPALETKIQPAQGITAAESRKYETPRISFAHLLNLEIVSHIVRRVKLSARRR